FSDWKSVLGSPSGGENCLHELFGNLGGRKVVRMFGGQRGEPHRTLVARKVTAAIRADLQVRFQALADAHGHLPREVRLQELDELLAGHGSIAFRTRQASVTLGMASARLRWIPAQVMAPPQMRCRRSFQGYRRTRGAIKALCGSEIGTPGFSRFV